MRFGHFLEEVGLRDLAAGSRHFVIGRSLVQVTKAYRVVLVAGVRRSHNHEPIAKVVLLGHLTIDAVIIVLFFNDLQLHALAPVRLLLLLFEAQTLNFSIRLFQLVLQLINLTLILFEHGLPLVSKDANAHFDWKVPTICFSDHRLIITTLLQDRCDLFELVTL